MDLWLPALFGVPRAKTAALTCDFAKPSLSPKRAESLAFIEGLMPFLAQNSLLDSQITQPAHQERHVLGIGIKGHPKTLLFAKEK